MVVAVKVVTAVVVLVVVARDNSNCEIVVEVVAVRVKDGCGGSSYSGRNDDSSRRD